MNDACSGGACVGGPPLDCNDGNVCTDDSCNPVSGCIHANNTLSCDDGSACTTNDVCSSGVCSGTVPGAASHLVISQIQVLGSGSADDEFVEIYNPTNAAVGLSGLSLQYKAATGSSYVVFSLPAQTIPSHGWYLVARSAYNGATPADAINSAFLMAAGGGNLFLVNGTGALSGSCSASASIIDKVGYGNGNCPETTALAKPLAEDSVLRKPGGSCGDGVDTNSNVADFVQQSPSTPHNRSSPPRP